jgi:hypothetical protein
MDAALATMDANCGKNTGRPLEAWIGIARRAKPAKHGETVKPLKEKPGMGHGCANLVARRALAGENDIDREPLGWLRAACGQDRGAPP